MKAKELIELLKKYDPDKNVMIQQGEEDEFDYATVHGVDELELFDFNNIEDDEIEAIVIKYE